MKDTAEIVYLATASGTPAAIECLEDNRDPGRSAAELDHLA